MARRVEEQRRRDETADEGENRNRTGIFEQESKEEV